MKHAHILALAVMALILAGCASQPEPEQRPYTDAEVKQFALEMLSRSGLPYDDYEKLRQAILNPKVPEAGKDLPKQMPRKS
jgi:PBP1b-binding outer membrane lipoprotein LpoB